MELRTPLDNPIGKSRTESIQPDYSLAGEPITNPMSSVLVVECKQYSKPSTEEFSSALIDYARGREKACVILASYGAVSKKIHDNINNKISDIDPEINTPTQRTYLIDELNPACNWSINHFKQIVKKSINGK